MNRIDGNGFNPMQSQQRNQGKVNQAYQSDDTKAPPKSAPKEQSLNNTSEVNISSAGRQLNQLEQEMSDTKAFNQEKVNLIKQAVDDGTYKPDTQAIAQKMVNFERGF